MQTLSFTFSNFAELADILTHPSQYDGIIATSANALKILLSDSGDPNPTKEFSLEHWYSKPLFVVGNATASVAHQLGFHSNSVIVGTGGAKELAHAINTYFVDKVQHPTPTGNAPNLLFLCGNRHLDELTQQLQAMHIDIRELVVYNTHLSPEIVQPHTAIAPKWVVFFSPSSVESAAQVLPFASPEWEYP